MKGQYFYDLLTQQLLEQSIKVNKTICLQYDEIVDQITKTFNDTSSLVKQMEYIENLPFGPLPSLQVCMQRVDICYIFLSTKKLGECLTSFSHTYMFSFQHFEFLLKYGANRYHRLRVFLI